MSDEGIEGVAALARSIREKLSTVQGRFPALATSHDWYMALAYAVRDRLLERGIATGETYYRARSRTVCYLSAEYLLGPHLGSLLLSLEMEDEAREALAALGRDLDVVLADEEEPGLGNGGLGRLAACFMESLATLQIPAIGYGIRYEFGIFDQAIHDGWQVELTDKWLARGNPWEIARPEITFDVMLGGRTEAYTDPAGRYQVRWLPERVVRGVAYDTMILGYRVNTANMLRLWKAEAVRSFDVLAFNRGDYLQAVEEKVNSENITKILYPNDQAAQGRRLRLEQQYFFVSCSLRDMIRIHLQSARDLTDFAGKYAVQLNDTHPAIGVAELMRLLLDEHGMDWEPAWAITHATFAYTNHTLLAEALETWPVSLFGAVLPRHLEIIYEINRRFLDEVRARYPGDDDRVRRLSLIDEAGERRVRMAHVACVGSYAVNGVAALHSRLLAGTVLRDFHELAPERFHNVTNGVTPRRFLAQANPRLAALLTEVAGDGWLTEMGRLRRLEPLAHDRAFQERWRAVRRENRQALAAVVRAATGATVDPEALLDVQVKRIHEYKRQHLNVLHVVALHQRLRRGLSPDAPPRTVLFAGKAAPGYRMAKLIIKLIHAVAATVNADPRTRDRLRVAFLPDYNVKHAMPVFGAADLSEQISTAGMEASGTGNMKLMMNGALTIGTLDGANVEIREAAGPEHFFLFGLNAEQVVEQRRQGYDPRAEVARDAELRLALDALAEGAYSHGDRELFRPLIDSLLDHDPYLVLADFRAYVDAQREVERAYADPAHWTAMSILNTARSGRFSSDRSITEYCRDIWHAGPVPVLLPVREQGAGSGERGSAANEPRAAGNDR